jgi:hypothetical protein
MRALVVFESMFGNTRALAEAIGTGLAEYTPVEVVNVCEACPVPEVDLLIVGGPTHGRGLSNRSSRQQGTEPAACRRTGLREWLQACPHAGGSGIAAAFDTRLDHPRWLTGSASRAITRRLARHGYRLIATPASFVVAGCSGPLRDGELERARRWGTGLAVAAAGATGATGAGRG